MGIDLFKGTLSPSLTDTIQVDGLPFDLTGPLAVTFKMRLTTSSATKVSAAATVVSAAAGTVRYDWAGTDTDTPGLYAAWWTVTLANGHLQDTPEFDLEIIEHAPSSTSDLCTVADIKMLMEIDDDSFDEDRIAESITEASATIMNEYELEFAPATASAKRRFKVVGNRV